MAPERPRSPYVEAEARHGIVLVDDVDSSVANGVFAPRDGVALSPSRVRELTRSWEQFDRVFAALSEGDADRLLRDSLWPFLTETQLACEGAAGMADHLILFASGAVAVYSPIGWTLLLATWARETAWRGRSDWHPDELAAALE